MDRLSDERLLRLQSKLKWPADTLDASDASDVRQAVEELLHHRTVHGMLSKSLDTLNTAHEWMGEIADHFGDSSETSDAIKLLASATLMLANTLEATESLRFVAENLKLTQKLIATVRDRLDDPQKDKLTELLDKLTLVKTNIEAFDGSH